MWFKVDYNKLAILLLPTFLRGQVMIGYLQALITPLVTIYDAWSVKRVTDIYKLNHNGQVCYLRKVLNDAFDPDQRRIKIGEGNQYERKYIYTSGEKQPKYLGRIYIRQSGDYADTGVDFRVVIPIGFNLDQVIHQMKALIDFYKLAGKRYKIEYDG